MCDLFTSRGPRAVCVTSSDATPQFVESNIFRVITSARQWKDAEEGSAALGVAPPPPGILGADGAVHPAYSLSTGSGLSEASIIRIMGQLLSGLSFMVGRGGAAASNLHLLPSGHPL